MSRKWVTGGFSESRNSLRWSVACYSAMGSLWGGFAQWKVPKTPLMDIARKNERHIRNQRPKISPKKLLPECKVASRAAPPKIANWYLAVCMNERSARVWELKFESSASGGFLGRRMQCRKPQLMKPLCSRANCVWIHRKLKFVVYVQNVGFLRIDV